MSLSSKHVGFFFAREIITKAIIERESVDSVPTEDVPMPRRLSLVAFERICTLLSLSLSCVRACVCVGRAIRDGRRSSNPAEERTLTFLVRVSA